MSRLSTMPRIVWPLLLLVALLSVWLLIEESVDGPIPLFTFEAQDVQRIDVHRDSRSYSLIRNGDDWLLEGDLLDHLDPKACALLLDDFCAIRRSPGGVVEKLDDVSARLYGFDREAPSSVVLFDGEGRSERVVIGGENEVTGAVYVQIPASEAVYLSQGLLKERLDVLPNGIRALALWPEFVAADADTVRVLRAEGGPLLFSKDEWGFWWLRDGLSKTFPRPSVDFHEFASDRRKLVSSEPWVLANAPAMLNLLSALDDTKARDFESRPPVPAPRLRSGLIVTSASGESHRVDFGEELEQRRTRAWRDHCPLGFSLSAPPFAFLDSLAGDPVYPFLLNLSPTLADSLSFELSEELVLRTVRNSEGRWVPKGVDDSDPIWLDQLGDMIVNLGRERLSAVMTPMLDVDAVFRDRYRLRFKVYGRGPDGTMMEEWILGVAADEQGVVAWRPTDGLRCRVDRQALISARGLIMGWDSKER